MARPPDALRLLTSVSIALVLAGCGSHRAPAASPGDLGRPPAISQLQRDLDALLAGPELARGTWGVAVRSLNRDETLYAVNDHKLFVPASNMKLVTLAAAAERLGWDYSFETKLVGTGPVESGALTGDLVVVGTGDPSIDDWDGAATTLFQGWADQLKSAGIRSVSGRLVGDDNAFDEESLGWGWAWDDLDRSFAAGVGALQFNQNTARLTISPGHVSDEPASAAIAPDGTGLDIRGVLMTGTAGSAASIQTRRMPGSPTLDVRGTVPIGSASFVVPVSVPNPTRYFTAALHAALTRNGIPVGEFVDVDDLAHPPVTVDGITLLRHLSPPLSVLAIRMMTVSQNVYAEALLKAMGAQMGTGTAAAGRAAVMATIQAWGIPASDVVVADGSGLSRYNLVTPRALLAILARAHTDDRLKVFFAASLPAGGRDGTLAQRLKGTRAEGNVRAKTGALSNARSLSGYVTTADGELLGFSVLANNFGVPADVVERTIDAIAVRLAEFSR